jgi:peptidoglycan/LPS O-acetylase OafA/YrhL
MAAASLRSAVLPLLILCTVLRPLGAVGRLLETRAARWLGAISYSLYLWQQLFLVWDTARVPVLKPLQNFPLGLVAALACAWASFTFVERPLIALGRRWSESSLPRAAPAAPR